jgi:hypothetical protein
MKFTNVPQEVVLELIEHLREKTIHGHHSLGASVWRMYAGKEAYFEHKESQRAAKEKVIRDSIQLPPPKPKGPDQILSAPEVRKLKADHTLIERVKSEEPPKLALLNESPESLVKALFPLGSILSFTVPGMGTVNVTLDETTKLSAHTSMAPDALTVGKPVRRFAVFSVSGDWRQSGSIVSHLMKQAEVSMIVHAAAHGSGRNLDACPGNERRCSRRPWPGL